MPILRQFLQRHNCVPSMSDKGGRCMSECIASLSPMSGSWLCVETMSERVCAPSIPMWLCRLSHFSNQGNPMHCFSTPLSQLRQQRGIVSQENPRHRDFCSLRSKCGTQLTVCTYRKQLLPPPSSTFHALSLPVTTFLSSHHHRANWFCYRRVRSCA